MFLNLVWGILYRIFFPVRCFSCGRIGAYLCNSCSKNFRLYSPHCIYCQNYSAFGITHKKCSGHIKRTIPLFYFTGTVKKILKNFKYRKATESVIILKEIINLYIRKDFFHLFDNLFKNGKEVVLIPVPMHRKKLARRGYSHTTLLAHVFCDVFSSIYTINCSVYDDAVIKYKVTVSQTTLSSKERINNVSGSFLFNIKFAKMLKEKQILIIDDVITTGATVNEVAKVISPYNNDISIVSVARD